MNFLSVPEVVIEDCENQGTKWKSSSLDRQWFLAAGLEEEEQGDDPRSFSGKELGWKLHVPGAQAAPAIDDRAGARDYRQRTLCTRLGSRHSFNDIADAPELITLEAMPMYAVVDHEANTVSFNAALKYGELVRDVERRRCGLAQPSFASPHLCCRRRSDSDARLGPDEWQSRNRGRRPRARDVRAARSSRPPEENPISTASWSGSARWAR